MTIDVGRFNGEFLSKVHGETPNFREVLLGEKAIAKDPEKHAKGEKVLGDPIVLNEKEVREIEKRINDALREKHLASDKTIRWLPAMGVKQLSFVADKEFSIQIKRKKLRKSYPDSFFSICCRGLVAT